MCEPPSVNLQKILRAIVDVNGVLSSPLEPLNSESWGTLKRRFPNPRPFQLPSAFRPVLEKPPPLPLHPLCHQLFSSMDGVPLSGGVFSRGSSQFKWVPFMFFTTLKQFWWWRWRFEYFSKYYNPSKSLSRSVGVRYVYKKSAINKNFQSAIHGIVIRNYNEKKNVYFLKKKSDFLFIFFP